MLRKVDELGRLVLPAEYRQALHIQEKDEVEITLKQNEMSIKKPTAGCVFCSAAIDLVRIGNVYTCRSCIDRLHAAKENELIYPVKTD